MKHFIVILLALGFYSCDFKVEKKIDFNSSTTPKVEFYSSEESIKADYPFSDAVKIDDFIILSGVVGNIPGNESVVEGGIQAETKQALENIKKILEYYDLTMDNIVKCTCMIDDISEWGEMNKVYKTYFTKNRPARSAFGADGLALGAKLELECWAVIN
ncbi:MAG: RidA family protein [Flavobacteriales bacterium]|jgi:2-iminobutanoate/2-iminopropanoate deaminase|tara:strand:- start:124 stop:600 length:477 start_codon:yes stop_codon:yes gene_type:complete